MKEYRPVEVPNASFVFCRTTLAVLFWAAWLLKIKLLVVFCFVLLVFSALLKVKNAPLVFFYTQTFNRLFPSKTVILDENAVRFAHITGAVFAGAAVIFLYFINPYGGWVITGVLTLLKTSGALGFCGAMKLYGCLTNSDGQCCRLGRTIKRHQCD